MLPARFELFTWWGVAVRAHVSWLPLGVLLTWTLAEIVFPFLVPELSVASYWWMAVGGIIGLFLSILVRELALALAARLLDIPILGTTLFVFGGSADAWSDKTSGRREFLMAAIGVLTSLVLGAALLLLLKHGPDATTPLTIAGVVFYLGAVNWTLALFNLVPAYPLDGGRILRAALAAWKKDMRWASRIAAGAGSVFGMLLVALGILSIIRGNFVGGMWLFLIGVLLHGAADIAYRQTREREVPAGRSPA